MGVNGYTHLRGEKDSLVDAIRGSACKGMVDGGGVTDANKPRKGVTREGVLPPR